MRELIASGGGINWCWYHWLTVDDEARTVVQTRADRFHRFNYEQGADNHPVATAKSFDVYNAPADTPERRATWGDARVDQWQADWVANLARWGLPPDTRSVAMVDGAFYTFMEE